MQVYLCKHLCLYIYMHVACICMCVKAHNQVHDSTLSPTVVTSSDGNGACVGEWACVTHVCSQSRETLLACNVS